jgi:hypothetical protein
VDHYPSALGHAGEMIEDTRAVVGLTLYAMAIAGWAASLYMLGDGDLDYGIITMVAAAVVGAAGALGIHAAHRRLVRLDLQWKSEHPQVPR